ncbi:ATP-binding cassette domain-containing protein, partial [Arthrospira platensis SPKY2]
MVLAARTVLAALVQVDKHYGEQTILAGAGLELRAAERLALIGRNGSGKTTILRLLDGSESPDGGEVVRRSDVTFGRLEQDARFAVDEVTIGAVGDAAFAPLEALE